MRHHTGPSNKPVQIPDALRDRRKPPLGLSGPLQTGSHCCPLAGAVVEGKLCSHISVFRRRANAFTEPCSTVLIPVSTNWRALGWDEGRTVAQVDKLSELGLIRQSWGLPEALCACEPETGLHLPLARERPPRRRACGTRSK